MSNAKYSLAKSVLAKLDDMARELEELRTYKQDSELLISGLQHELNEILTQEESLD